MKSNYKKVEPIQKLVIVNQRMRHGDVSKISKKLETTSHKVNSVLDGKSEDSKILNAAYNMTRNRKKNTQVIKTLTAKKNAANVEG